MENLLHNPFTDLALPYFLAFYGAGGIVALIAGGVAIWLADGTRDDDLPDEDVIADPYALAYLRGGSAQVARLAVYDLLQRGYLGLAGSSRKLALFAPATTLQRRRSAPPVSELNALQRAAWDWAEIPRVPAEITDRSNGLVQAIRPLCGSCTASLAAHRLLECASHRATRSVVAWSLIVILTGAGLYKGIADLITQGSESLSLVLPMLAWFVCTIIICRPVRLSDRGTRFLEFLRVTDNEQLPPIDESHAADAAIAERVHAERLRSMALSGTTRQMTGRSSLRDLGANRTAEPEAVGG